MQENTSQRLNEQEGTETTEKLGFLCALLFDGFRLLHRCWTLLLEDEAQGTSVDCLCCKRPVELMLELAEENLEPPDADEKSPPHDPSSQTRFIVRQCPKCLNPIRIPPEKKRQAVSCLNCEFWGILSQSKRPQDVKLSAPIGMRCGHTNAVFEFSVISVAPLLVVCK